MKIFAHLLFSHETEAEGVRNGRRRLDIRRGNIADGPTKRIINTTNVIRKCYPSQACICSLPRCISDSLPRPASDIHQEICRLALLKLTWDFSQRRIRRWWIWKNRNRKVTLTLLRYLENYTFLKYACISTLHTLHRLSFSVMLPRRCIRSLQMEKVQVKKQKRKTRIWRRWLQFVANEMHSRPENAKR